MRSITVAAAAVLSPAGAFAAGRWSAAGAAPLEPTWHIGHDPTVARRAPGTHDGGGWTAGCSFFDDVAGMPFVFRTACGRSARRIW